MARHERCAGCATPLTDDNRTYYGCSDDCPCPSNHQAYPPVVPANVAIRAACPNHGQRDPLSAYCTACWAKTTPFEPTCAACNTPLVQDRDNLFRLYCPALCPAGERTLRPLC